MAHPLQAVGPFNQVQAEIDYNLVVLRRMRIVAWDCSTVTLLKIRAALTEPGDANAAAVDIPSASNHCPLRRINVPFAA